MKRLIVSATILVSLASTTALALPTAVLAAKPDATSSDTSKVNVQAGKVTTNCSDQNDVCLAGLPQTKATAASFQNAISILIGIVAAISVLFVAIGGLRYVFAQGDPSAVGKAKSTIIYAMVGLVVCILAQSIVVLVVKAIS